MIATDKSIIITFAVPIFLLLIFIEYVYGVRTGKNNYRVSDTFTSLGLGLISRLPPMLNLGFQGVVFAYIGSYFHSDFLSSQSIWTWLIAFVFYDFLYYWMHRTHHEIKVLWATHCVHHHGEEFNLSTALRQTSTGWLWKWVFYLPMIVIGIPAQVFVTVAGINLVYQFWVHTKHIGHLGVFEKVFVTPMNHGIHHAKNPEYIDANYGGVFIIWDRMFGTYIPERPDIEPVYGTVKPLNSWNPIWANFQVFYQMIQDTIHTKKISNKIKIWYSSTSWRPEDVIDNNPNPDPALFKQKYSPPLNKQQKIFGIIQIFSTIIIAGSITVTLASQTYQETAIFGLIFILGVLLTSYILQNKENSFNIQLGVSSILILAIYFGGLVNLNLLATQLILIHSFVNILYIGISIPIQKYSFKGSTN